MKITGIIAEYNPFHNGHALQAAEIKRKEGGCVIAVCGGFFTQRGELSALSKIAKAKAAIAGGVDVVLELPLCYTVSPAPDFAMGGVGILNALGAVDNLAFGCEQEPSKGLFELFDALENADYSRIKDRLKTGLSFSAAREETVSAVDGNFAHEIRKPNNILALEYLSALKKTSSGISPLPIKRVGADHNSDEICGNICSATKLRNILKDDFSAAKAFMPERCFDILEEQHKIGRAPLSLESVENAVIFALRGLCTDEIASVNGVSEGMEHLIFEGISKFSSIEGIVDYCSGKRYTKARIRRILMCAVLGITKELAHTPPPYIRVLAFSDIGREALKALKKSAVLPVVTKAADIPKISSKAEEFFAVECRAADLASLAFDPKGKKGLEYCENFFS